MPAYKKERKGGGRSKAGVKNKSLRGEKKKQNYFQFEVISIQSSLSKLFTEKSYDSLQVGVDLISHSSSDKTNPLC